jgi:hypothetical protein
MNRGFMVGGIVAVALVVVGIFMFGGGNEVVDSDVESGGGGGVVEEILTTGNVAGACSFYITINGEFILHSCTEYFGFAPESCDSAVGSSKFEWPEGGRCPRENALDACEATSIAGPGAGFVIYNYNPDLRSELTCEQLGENNKDKYTVEFIPKGGL